MHSASTILPQVFHKVAALAFACVLGTVTPVLAQAPSDVDTTLHRVFLRDGSALPSYGAPVAVADRVVFNLFLKFTRDRPDLQLMSLPADSVDRERTERYSTALRARHYLATRAETDYAAMSSEVFRALDQLATVQDTQQRLRLAEEARRRLLEWSAAHYAYRAADIQELASLFEDVINELRVAAGSTRFSFELVAARTGAAPEPLAAPLTLRESIARALAAAGAADLIEERYAILRSIEAATRGVADLEDLGTTARARLAAEVRTDAAYRELASMLKSQAGRARARGDVAAAEALRAQLSRADLRLGKRRPAVVVALDSELADIVEATKVRRLSLDHYAYVRRELLRYERRTRGALGALESAKVALERIKSTQSVPFAELEAISSRLAAELGELAGAAPPADVADVHETLLSAMRMASEACARRVRAVITKNLQADREASSAAAAALLLGERGRQDLVAAMYPPKEP